MDSVADKVERVTIGELGARAGIARTTARRYVKDFGIKPTAGGKRFVLYDVTDVDKLIKIKELYLRGLTTREIKRALFGVDE